MHKFLRIITILSVYLLIPLFIAGVLVIYKVIILLNSNINEIGWINVNPIGFMIVILSIIGTIGLLFGMIFLFIDGLKQIKRKTYKRWWQVFYETNDECKRKMHLLEKISKNDIYMKKCTKDKK